MNFPLATTKLDTVLKGEACVFMIRVGTDFRFQPHRQEPSTFGSD
jgi:hypothetical protein